MPEETIWRGTASQLRNTAVFFLWAGAAIVILGASIAAARAADPRISGLAGYTLLLLIVPIFMVLARYLQTKSRIYELTTERLKMTEGVFGRVTDTLELYRVKDLEVRQPFSYRLVGLENIQINTSDASSPFVVIEAVSAGIGLADKLRNQVEIIRAQKNVREIDME